MRSGEFFDICMEKYFLRSLILESCPKTHFCVVTDVSVEEENKVHVVRYDIAAI
jgi:hypothetical protein